MCWFKKKKKPLSDKEFFTQNRNLIKFHDALWHPNGGDGDVDSTLAFVSIDPSTFKASLPVERFELTENEQKVLDAIHEINRFDAPDLSDMTFYEDDNMNEYTFYETMLDEKLEKMTGIVYVQPEDILNAPADHLQDSVHILATSYLPEKGYLAGGEYARALKIMKYQTPEHERYKPKIKKTKPKTEPQTSPTASQSPNKTPKFCPHCGFELTPNAKFCMKCGKPA